MKMGLINTTLTLNDLYLVKIGNALTTWSGDTINVIVVGVSQNKIPFWGNKTDYPAEVYLLENGDAHQIAMDLNGIHCLSFYTPKIKEILR